MQSINRMQKMVHGSFIRIITYHSNIKYYFIIKDVKTQQDFLVSRKGDNRDYWTLVLIFKVKTSHHIFYYDGYKKIGTMF